MADLKTPVVVSCWRCPATLTVHVPISEDGLIQKQHVPMEAAAVGWKREEERGYGIETRHYYVCDECRTDNEKDDEQEET